MLCSLVLQGTIKQSDMDTAVGSVDGIVKVRKHTLKAKDPLVDKEMEQCPSVRYMYTLHTVILLSQFIYI